MTDTLPQRLEAWWTQRPDMRPTSDQWVLNIRRGKAFWSGPDIDSDEHDVLPWHLSIAKMKCVERLWAVPCTLNWNEEDEELIVCHEHGVFKKYFYGSTLLDALIQAVDECCPVEAKT